MLFKNVTLGFEQVLLDLLARKQVGNLFERELFRRLWELLQNGSYLLKLSLMLLKSFKFMEMNK